MMSPTGVKTGVYLTPEEWFHSLATHYVEAQVLYYLNTAGVIGLLASGTPRATQEVAVELGLDHHTLACCMEYLARVSDLFVVDDTRYALSAFGAQVVRRYSRMHADGRVSLNLFDVRVGSYGPVWSALGAMLTGEATYGRDVQRDGALAATGVYKVAGRIVAPLNELLCELHSHRVVEVGVPAGLLEGLVSSAPERLGVGLDRHQPALVEAEARAKAQGVEGLTFVHGDFFEPDTWVGQLPMGKRGAIVSIHFHELVADGGERLVRTLARLRELLPGWHVVVVEQDQLKESARSEVSSTLWSYNASNVLIHHLIGNGRILSRDEWLALFLEAGTQVVRINHLGFLGYNAYVLEL